MSRVSGTAIYLRDHFLTEGETPSVSLFDRGYLLGDSVFATLRGYGANVFGLDAHTERFFAAADACSLRCPVSAEGLRAIVHEALVRANLAESAVRVTLSRGEGDGGFGTTGREVPTLSVIARPLPPIATQPVSTTVLSSRAVPPECGPVAHKVGSYMSHVVARREAAERGFGDGIVLSIDGELVVSGTVANLFLCIGNRLVTPSLERGGRAGFMRETLLRIAANEGIATDVRPVALREIGDATDLFFTSSLIEIQSIGIVDSTRIGNGTYLMTDRLRRALKKQISIEIAS